MAKMRKYMTGFLAALIAGAALFAAGCDETGKTPAADPAS